MNKLNDTMKRLDKAYNLVSRIPVTGDNVDIMALARMELRCVYADLAAMSKQEANDGSPD